MPLYLWSAAERWLQWPECTPDKLRTLTAKDKVTMSYLVGKSRRQGKNCRNEGGRDRSPERGPRSGPDSPSARANVEGGGPRGNGGKGKGKGAGGSGQQGRQPREPLAKNLAADKVWAAFPRHKAFEVSERGILCTESVHKAQHKVMALHSSELGSSCAYLALASFLSVGALQSLGKLKWGQVSESQLLSLYRGYAKIEKAGFILHRLVIDKETQTASLERTTQVFVGDSKVWNFLCIPTLDEEDRSCGHILPIARPGYEPVPLTELGAIESSQSSSSSREAVPEARDVEPAVEATPAVEAAADPLAAEPGPCVVASSSARGQGVKGWRVGKSDFWEALAKHCEDSPLEPMNVLGYGYILQFRIWTPVKAPVTGHIQNWPEAHMAGPEEIQDAYLCLAHAGDMSIRDWVVRAAAELKAAAKGRTPRPIPDEAIWRFAEPPCAEHRNWMSCFYQPSSDSWIPFEWTTPGSPKTHPRLLPTEVRPQLAVPALPNGPSRQLAAEVPYNGLWPPPQFKDSRDADGVLTKRTCTWQCGWWPNTAPHGRTPTMRLARRVPDVVSASSDQVSVWVDSVLYHPYPGGLNFESMGQRTLRFGGRGIQYFAAGDSVKVDRSYYAVEEVQVDYCETKLLRLVHTSDDGLLGSLSRKIRTGTRGAQSIAAGLVSTFDLPHHAITITPGQLCSTISPENKSRANYSALAMVLPAEAMPVFGRLENGAARVQFDAEQGAPDPFEAARYSTETLKVIGKRPFSYSGGTRFDWGYCYSCGREAPIAKCPGRLCGCGPTPCAIQVAEGRHVASYAQPIVYPGVVQTTTRHPPLKKGVETWATEANFRVAPPPKNSLGSCRRTRAVARGSVASG